MSQIGASGGVLLEQYDITSDSTGVDLTSARDSLDATTFGNTGHRFVAGLVSGGVQIKGLFNSGLAGLYTVLVAIFAASTSKIATTHPKGTTAGYPAELCYGDETKFDDSVRCADLISLVAYIQAAERGVEFGVWLASLAAVTATGNGTDVDNGAATTNGGVGVLHTTDIAGASPSVTWKIQHSVDGSTWADLLTFTAQTAVGAQRVEVAAGTTVNRHRRAVRTFGGTTTSITSAVAFANR
jgi:hypothetical protein